MGGFWLSLNVISLPLLLSVYNNQGVRAADSPYLNPGFEFFYDVPNQANPIPVTLQCDTIRLRWTRDGNSTGPLPVAPYSLLVYSSTSSVPYTIAAGFGPTFNWQVPFAPNTQYQICMFDTNGVSGGCQQMFTMISSNSTGPAPTCQNVTAPTSLSVSATVPFGAMFQNSYIDQCTSLSVTPTSGSPPYTLTIAPDYHPPYNITSNSNKPIPWQVALPVGSRFFLSLESSDGSMWANGPLRVGGMGPSDCLVPGSVTGSFFEKISISASVGSFVLGIAAGIFGYLAYLRLARRRKKSPSQSYLATEYKSRNSPTRPLTAPSLIGGSTFVTTRSGAPSMMSSVPTMPPLPQPTTPPSRSTNLPLEPVRPAGSSMRRNRMADPNDVSSDAESTVSRAHTATTTATTTVNHNHYPLDVKRPLPTSPGPADASYASEGPSMSSSSSPPSSSAHTYTSPGRRARPISIQSRAPTYVPRSSNLRGTVGVVNEAEEYTELGELPPEYGRHTTDPSLNYAPSVLSSGHRF